MTVQQRSEATTAVGSAAQGSTAATASEQEGARAVIGGGPLAVGAVLDRYTILERLGAGGMGEVYAAYDKKLDRKVALKLLRHRSEEYEARLEREAQAMARLLHPNVVAVFDTGVTGSRLYLAMEFVRGTTLRHWERAEKRSLEAILRVYAEAGEGLAAAHAAGLVHRDFKPENVLIADDGRVKVTDFGIARALEEKSDASAPSGSGEGPAALAASGEVPIHAANTQPSGGSFENPLTKDGTLLGTPGYMAPEQFLCLEVDERTDQFSFCVSLYQALYGVKPFVGGSKAVSLEQLARATLEGKIDDAPKGSAVPAHVRRVLVRGLSAERNERYPSMRALLEDLRKDPRTQRRTRLLSAAVALTIAATGAVTTVSTLRHRAAVRSACAAEAGAIYTHWTPAAQETLKSSMLADEGASKVDRTKRAVAALDQFAAGWKGEAEASCLSTRLAKTQAEDVYEKRSACLLGARQRFDATVDILGERDSAVHRRAFEVLGRALQAPRMCGRSEAERAFVPLPTDPARRAMAEEARVLISRAHIAALSGRMKSGVATAEKAVELSRKAGVPADESAALVMLAWHLERLFDAKAALAKTKEALRAAERAGDDRAAIKASMSLARILGTGLHKHDEAKEWLDMAWAKLAHYGQDDELEANLRVASASAAFARGDLAAALDGSQEMIERLVAIYGENSPHVCMALNNRAIIWTLGRDFSSALRGLREAASCQEAVNGKDDPVLGMLYLNMGSVLAAQGKREEAAQAFLHASELRAELGPTDPLVAESLASVALTEGALGRFREAEAHAKKALASLDRVAAAQGSLDHTSKNTRRLALQAMGVARAGQGDLAEGRSHCARAVTVLDEMLDEIKDEPLEHDPIRCLGEIELAAGDVAQARKDLERSLGLTKRYFPGDLAVTRLALARALVTGAKRDPVRAREQALLARTELARDMEKDPTLASVLAEVDRLLARPETSP